MENFERQYRLIAGVSGRPGFEIGETTEQQPVALHISFSVEKSGLASPNTAKITLWNLSPEQLETLNTWDCYVTLKAGYGNSLPLIFSGAITNLMTMLDGADMKTEIEAVDGRVELRDTYLSLAYAGKINTKKIIEDIAREMGMAATFSPKATFVDFPNGFSFVGSAKEGLQKICEASSLNWTIQNGILQVTSPNEPISTRMYQLSAESGLIDVPKKVVMSSISANLQTANKTSERGQVGWEVRYLMNGAVGVNDYVKLKSRFAEGEYRVFKLLITGDNLEGEWTCEAQLLEVGK